MKDLGWTVMHIFLMLEVAAVSVLIIPMPSNTVRGFLIEGLRKMWSVTYVKYVCVLVLVLDAFLFYDAMSTIHGDSYHQNKVHYFRQQQHAYLTGFSIGLFFVLNRLLDLNTQLFDARKAQKQLQKDKKDA